MQYELEQLKRAQQPFFVAPCCQANHPIPQHRYSTVDCRSGLDQPHPAATLPSGFVYPINSRDLSAIGQKEWNEYIDTGLLEVSACHS